MELFHVLNRGVDKRKIFLDDQDHFRFIHDLFEFNDEDNVETASYRFYQFFVVERRKIDIKEKPERKKRKLLVNLHAFCLMPNHYHLLVSAQSESGIAKFMKKVNAGYSRYFNEKYKRRGTLFEGRYKSILVKDEAHFIHIPYYIHLNPLDLIAPEWRERKLKNYNKAIDFLESYRWSSHLDYAGKHNFPSVTQRDFLTEIFGGSKNYSHDIKKWLKNLDYSTFAPSSLFENKTIQANGYFVVANSSGGITGDVATTYGISDNNTIVLKNPNREMADKVGWGEAQDCEGGACAQNPDDDKSIHRKFVSSLFVDTDVNSNDFEIQDCPSPKSQPTACVATNIFPTALFSHSPLSPEVGENVSFDASASSDSDGTISRYEWDFGDGNLASSTESLISHAYLSQGTYNATLTAVDDDNASSQKTLFLEISAATDRYAGTLSNHIVISEIYPDKTGNNYDFVELYNPTQAPANLSDYSLRILKNNSSTSTPLADFSGEATTTIPALGFFLVGLDNYNLSGLTSADIKRTASLLSSTSATVLLVNNNETIDEVFYDPAQLGDNNSFERRTYDSGYCVLPTGNNEFSGNGCDTDNQNDIVIRQNKNPQNSESLPEPREAPLAPENFQAEYNPNKVSIDASWDEQIQLEGTKYKIFNQEESGTQILLNETAATSSQVRTKEIGKNYHLIMKAVDKDGMESDSVEETINVPSLLSSLYFYQDTRTQDFAPLVEMYYSQYPFTPNLFDYNGWTIALFYLNSDAENFEDIFNYNDPTSSPSLMQIAFKRCSGGYVSQGKSLLLPNDTSRCGVSGSAYNSSMDFGELEDNHILANSYVQNGDSRFDFVNSQNNYLTAAFYSSYGTMPSDGRVPYFHLVATDKTKYYFGNLPTHSAPVIPEQFNVQFDQQESKLTTSWSAATDDDTIDSKIKYEIRYKDGDQWKDVLSQTSETRFVIPDDSLNVSVRAKDDFGNYSQELSSSWLYPNTTTYISQIGEDDWSYEFGTKNINCFYYSQPCPDTAALQSITPESDMVINNVVLKIKQDPIRDLANLRLSVYADSGNNIPDFNNLLGSSILHNIIGFNGPHEMAFSFQNNIQLLAEQKYWLVLDVDGYVNQSGHTPWGRNRWYVAINKNSDYSGGVSGSGNAGLCSGYCSFSSPSPTENSDWYMKIGLIETSSF